MRKDFFMEIRKTMGRFVSIFFIVALGVAFYSGIRASEPSMRISGDSYFDKENLMDIKVLGTLGLTEEDVQAIEETQGIEKAEGGYSKDVLCPVGENEAVVHVLSRQEDFNAVQVTEGRLPKKEGECLIDEDFAAAGGFKVGDQVTFRSGDDEPLSDSLTTETFEVVGIGNSPLYISFGRGNSMIGTGEVSGFVIVDESSFKMDVYTEIYASVTGAFDEVAFTSEYEKLSDGAIEALEGIEEERCEARREEILAEVDGEFADAEKTVSEESEKLDDAKKTLADEKSSAAKQLEEARKKLEDGERVLEESRQQIADGEAQIEAGKQQLREKQNEIDEGWKQYEEGVIQLAQKEGELLAGEQVYQENYDKYMPIIAEGKAEIAKSRQELANQKTSLQEELNTLTGIQNGLAAVNDKLQAVILEKAGYQSSLEQGRILFEIYSVIPEKDRTPEQQAYIESWPSEQEKLEKQIADADARQVAEEAEKAELIRQMNEAGFESEAGLSAQIASLQTKIDVIVKVEEGFDKAEEALLKQEQELIDAGKQIEEGKAQIAAGKKTLEESRAQLKSGQKQITEAWLLIFEKQGTLYVGKAELESGQKELEQGRSEYEQAATEATEKIADGEQKLADGEKEIIKARQEIADAKAEIDKIENPKWYIQDRNEALSDFEGYGENADRMRSIGQVFPVLFFLVAALISLTTMTRMVEEQRVQIGTLKALGYSKFSIAKKYIYYALVATLGGSIFGVLIGEKILPYIIIYAYKIMYLHIPDILVPYHMSYAVQATVIAVACTLLATLFSCYRELASQPAELMRPAAPKQGKRILLERIPFLWKRFNFTWKSSIRNLIRYKKRFFMTIFGIGGCMALMLVGFGLKDCIYEITELQYEKVQFYDATAFMDEDAKDEDSQELLDYLEEEDAVEGYIQTRMQNVKVKAGKEKESLYLMVPDSSTDVEEFLSFHSRTKEEEVYSLKEDQVILTEKISQLLDVKVGDTITIEDEDRGDKEVTVGAICENYLGHYLYMSPEKYEELYGAQPRYNSVLYSVKDGEEEQKTKQIEEIGSHLLENENVLNVTYTSSLSSSLGDMLKSLNLVIVVLIISAGMLAFVVLYNLNNINITERQRELATLKVLGFYDMEVASYVYRENILLTILGAIVGMGLGNILLQFIIVTVEVNEAMFGRQIHWPSYLYSFLLTVAFSLFVNWVMFYKLKKINMVESLKSVE